MHNDQRLEPSHTHVKLSTNICLIIILILAFFYRCGDCHLFFNIRFDLYCRAHLRAKYFCTTANHIWKVSCESRAIVLAMQSQLKESMVAKQSWLLRGASWWWLPQVILSQAWASVRLGLWVVAAGDWEDSALDKPETWPWLGKYTPNFQHSQVPFLIIMFLWHIWFFFLSVRLWGVLAGRAID